MQGQQPKKPINALELKAELARLRVKRSETRDPDIRSALDLRIEQVEQSLLEQKADTPEEPEIPEIPPEPPTTAQLREAEQLVRQARVEKMRENHRASTDLLKKAAEVAPGSPAVLETLGDDLAERRQYKQAREVYGRAFRLDPKNVGLERKYAICVSQMASMGSLDDQMRAHLSDSPFLSADDSLASGGAAIFLSALLPGLGHVVLGKTATGFGIMAAWLLCGGWLLLMYEDLGRLIGMATGGAGSPNPLVLLPVALMMAIYIGTLASFKGRGAAAKKKPLERPKPPVDLPFE